MTEHELKAQHNAIQDLRKAILKWIEDSPIDEERGIILSKLRKLHKKRSRAYNRNGGTDWLPIAYKNS